MITSTLLSALAVDFAIGIKLVGVVGFWFCKSQPFWLDPFPPIIRAVAKTPALPECRIVGILNYALVVFVGFGIHIFYKRFRSPPRGSLTTVYPLLKKLARGLGAVKRLWPFWSNAMAGWSLVNITSGNA